ncbi:MAG: hypothetical protein CSA62_06265 [Planctomycetota bacterium]|nr:MAG: hypothetical protein CSA62_06265 [Planctomycetota bacterium]
MSREAEEPLVPERSERLVVTVGEIWREMQVSCPHRDLWRQYLEGEMAEDAAGYLRFHLEEAQCPYCYSTAEDLRRAEAETSKKTLNQVRERLIQSTLIGIGEARRRH